MGEWVVALAGTPAGAQWATALALLSALAHATFGAVNKGGRDPLLNRGAINVAYALIAAPFALFILPWPSPALWAVLALSYGVHILYEWLQATSFLKGDFSVVYPLARGVGPLASAALAGLVFSESLGAGQWFGILLLSAAIMAFAAVNMADRGLGPAHVAGLRAAVLTALATGLMVAVYTTVDAYGMRVAEDPFTFLAWMFFSGGFGFPIIAYRRWRRMAPEARPPLGPLALRGAYGAVIAIISFGSAMVATRLGQVGEVAALRETSIVFATAIGVFIFREPIDQRRVALVALIVLGAVLVEAG